MEVRLGFCLVPWRLEGHGSVQGCSWDSGRRSLCFWGARRASIGHGLFRFVRSSAQVESSESDMSGQGRVGVVSLRGGDDVGTMRTILSLIVFGIYFCAALLLTRRLLFFEMEVFQKVYIMALAMILPDLARFSFVEIGHGASSSRAGSQSEVQKQARLPTVKWPVLLTNFAKILGFYLAALYSPTIGAVVTMASQVIFNILVHVGKISPRPYVMRTNNRVAIIILECISLSMAVCSSFSLYPMTAATTFFSIVLAYWLSKYDIDLLFPV